MALIKCPECMNDVSTAAAACPQCGFPITQQKNNLNEPEIIPKGMVRCRNCSSIVKPRLMHASYSSFIIAILLLCLGIIPGIIYIIWESSRKQCPKCKLSIK